MLDFYLTRALVAKLLEHPYDHDWSYQGFGMLRLYLSKSLRLHIWNPAAAVQDVSVLHTHPWNFSSLVISGVIKQNRYVKDPDGLDHKCQRIKCGQGGGPEGNPHRVSLGELSGERYTAGQTYSQRAYEIHQSRPEIGAVTVIQRDFLSDADHAEVFWPTGEEWVSAEPRTATHEEVEVFVTAAQEAWQ